MILMLWHLGSSRMPHYIYIIKAGRRHRGERYITRLRLSGPTEEWCWQHIEDTWQVYVDDGGYAEFEVNRTISFGNRWVHFETPGADAFSPDVLSPN